MKRYFFGILAVGIAFAAVAFQAPDNKFTDKRFLYNPPGGSSYSGTDVAEKGNWVYQPAGITCATNLMERACEIYVPNAQVDLSTNKLKTTFTITPAEHGSTGVFYVDAITAGNIYNDDY